MTDEAQPRTLLVLFVPSVDRDSSPIDQDDWVRQALEHLGVAFGGATAFPKARGVWLDRERMTAELRDLGRSLARRRPSSSWTSR